MLKQEYTNLRINHDNLVLSHELLSNEPHDATNNVVKIDIATSCDDLIVESIEQGSSSKGNKVVESDNYDDYVKLKKDLEKLSTTNTIVIENLDNNHDMALENEMLREENKKLKELKSSKKELKEKHDKLEGIHNELTISYNLLKEEYTNLKVNHDNLVVSHELLSNEPHDATNNVVKIDIATSCDGLIVESIE